MKTILLLFVSLNGYGQVQAFVDYLNISSCWYNEVGRMDQNNLNSFNRCYFSTSKYASDVILTIQSKEPILSPVFIFTNKGKYSLHIDNRMVKKTLYGVRYQSTVKLPYSNKALWTSIDSGILRVEFITERTKINLLINDNLTKLKNHGR